MLYRPAMHATQKTFHSPGLVCNVTFFKTAVAVRNGVTVKHDGKTEPLTTNEHCRAQASEEALYK